MGKTTHFFIQYAQEAINLIRLSVFQPRCPCCQQILVHKEEILLCQECKSEMVPFLNPVCLKCGKALSGSNEICGECLVNPPPYRKHISYARYEGVLKAVISRYKFRGMDPLKKNLAGFLVSLFRSQINESFDWMVPVPADRGRKRETNHILEICKILAKKLNIRLLKDNLVKVKKTLPQVKLSQAQRRRNLDGAFRLKDPAMVRNKKILLVDDVYTTGTTIKKCARLLKKARADVVAITLARSI